MGYNRLLAAADFLGTLQLAPTTATQKTELNDTFGVVL